MYTYIIYVFHCACTQAGVHRLKRLKEFLYSPIYVCYLPVILLAKITKVDKVIAQQLLYLKH